MQEQLDPQIVNLAKAIRQTESGGNFKAKGKSGEYGAFQFTQPTWEAQSKKFGVNVPLEQATPEQQNEVAYKQLSEWKQKNPNWDIGNFASAWNAGEGEPDSYKGTFSTGKSSEGVNKFGVKYSVPAYAKSVATAYQTIKGGGQAQQDTSNPSSVASDGFVRTAEIPNKPIENTATIDNKKGIFGENKNDDIYGKLIDNRITRGIQRVGDALTFGGSTQMGQGIAEVDPVKTAKGGLKTLAGVASILPVGAVLKGAEGLIKGANIVPKIFKGPGITRALEAFKMTPKELASLSKTEQVNFLEEALKTGGNKVPLTMRKEFDHAISKLLPAVEVEAGRAPGMAKKVVKGVAKTAWKGLKYGAGYETAKHLNLLEGLFSPKE